MEHCGKNNFRGAKWNIATKKISAIKWDGTKNYKQGEMEYWDKIKLSE